MLVYEYDNRLLEMEEHRDEDSIEFLITFREVAPYAAWLRKVEQFFDRNRDYTDVLFYKYPGGKYRVMVRPDYYASFLAELFKAHLLRKLEWTLDADEAFTAESKGQG
ncbi:hypothetical protein [Gorillibacterium timonense]|uniref:hypothetical protein n=1 Tax=Gorillibacterium timonense TaxID=1689269 RepID=UPI00071DDD23|nr:hypothetical protein [Gorillibacterium timonense]